MYDEILKKRDDIIISFNCAQCSSKSCNHVNQINQVYQVDQVDQVDQVNQVNLVFVLQLWYKIKVNQGKSR